jgi:Protein kinase domain
MGRVFLGRSAGGRLVAVKVIRAELTEEPGFRARFAREVAAARKVSGLFTAVLVDADTDGPVPWLATGYVPGPSLAEAVTRHGPLPVASVLTLAAGLAEALKVIHESGVIHRDLKPSNVLIADDGPRVIDFGISRAAEASVLTQAGSVMGSPGFMSPEQAEGGEISPASDVFSLGALLTFAATGEGPFGTGSMPALLYRVVHRPPSLDQLPAELRAAVERCLVKDPSQRATTAELLADLGTAGPAEDWLPESVAEAVGQFAAPLRATAGPAQVDMPAQRATGTAQPTGAPGQAADRPAQPGDEPAPAAARIPAAAAAPAFTAAAGVAVEDRPTSDFRSTDPSVPGLPLRLDSDMLPGGLSGPPGAGGAPSRPPSPPWSPGRVSDLARGGQSSPGAAPSRPTSPPWSPGRVSDLAGPGPSSPSAPPRAGDQPSPPGGVAAPAVGDRPPPDSAPPPPASGPPGNRPSGMMSARMQRALAEAVAQPPPSRFGKRLGGPGRRGGLWLLICSILVAAAAVALVLLTGFGQHSAPSTPQQTPAPRSGAPSSPAASHRHAQSASTRPAVAHALTGHRAKAAGAGVAGHVQSVRHTTATPTASSTPTVSSTPSAHAQAPAANPRPKAKSKAKPAPRPDHPPSSPTTPAVTHYSRTVPGTQAWTDSGIALHAGQRVSITASGQILVGPANGESPAGDPSCTPASNFPTQSAQFPAPGLPCWSLIARIGSGAPFEVGTASQITATSGELFLGVNASTFPASAGSWAAAISVSGPTTSA